MEVKTITTNVRFDITGLTLQEMDTLASTLGLTAGIDSDELFVRLKNALEDVGSSLGDHVGDLKVPVGPMKPYARRYA